MNWQHIQRIAWKDMRRMAPFWIALVAFWILCLGINAWMAHRVENYNSEIYIEGMIHAAVWTVIIYAMGWGAITYSVEHEEKTYPFLRSLPVNAKSVFYGKLLFGVLSAVAMISALAALAGLYVWGTPKNKMQFVELRSANLDSWKIFVGISWFAVGVACAIAIGIFWSLRIKRPMAAVATAICTPLAFFFVLMVIGDQQWFKQFESTTGQNTISAILFAFLGIVTLVLFALARSRVTKWLHDPEDDATDPDNAFAAPATASLSTSTGKANRSGIRRLLWLQRKENRIPLATNIVTSMVAFVLLIFRLEAGNRNETVFNESPLIYLSLLAAGLLGITAFRSEHRDARFRLHAQIGVHPFPYWLSRLLLPAIACAVCAWVVSIPYAGEWVDLSKSESHLPSIYTLAALGSLSVFSISQFCSIAWRSTIIAGAAAFLASLVVMAWMLMCSALGVHWSLVFLPIIICPLIASYWRVPRWFQETGSWKQWIVPILPLALLMVGLPIATALFRVHQLPKVDLPPELLAVYKPSTVDLASVKTYESVFAKLPTPEDWKESKSVGAAHLVAHASKYDNITQSEFFNDWTSDNHSIVEEFMEATKTGTVLHIDAKSSGQHSVNRHAPIAYRKAVTGAAILLISARQAEDRNEIDEAWDYYAAALELAKDHNDGQTGMDGIYAQWDIENAVHRQLVPWAMLEANTPETVEQAALFLDDYRKNQPPWTHFLAADYQHAQETISDWETYLANRDNRERGFGPSRAVPWFASFMPWEAQRTRRMNDAAYLLEYELLREVESGRVQWVGGTFKNADWAPTSGPKWQERVAAIWDLQFTTLGDLAGYLYSFTRFQEREFERRGVICQLACIAEHLETGEYPSDLSTLTIGDRPIPDDYCMPEKKLLIGDDTLPEDAHKRHAQNGHEYPLVHLPVPGLYLRSRYLQQSAYIDIVTTSDGNSFYRHFVLPIFEDWSRERYQERIERTRQIGRQEIEEEDEGGSRLGFGFDSE